MSWILSIAIVVLLSVGICESANLTAITWKHDVNTHNLLEEAFKSNFSHLNVNLYEIEKMKIAIDLKYI